MFTADLPTARISNRPSPGSAAFYSSPDTFRTSRSLAATGLKESERLIGRRFYGQNGRDDLGWTFRLEGPASAEQFIEDRTEAEDVAAAVQLFAAHLLGRHVRDAVPITIPGMLNMVGGILSSVPGPLSIFARPKSSTFTCLRVVSMMFSGLMSRWMMPREWASARASAIWVAMPRASRESGSPRVSLAASVLPFDVLKDNEAVVAFLADLIDSAYVGVIERGCGLRLSYQTLFRPFIASDRRRAET